MDEKDVSKYLDSRSETPDSVPGDKPSAIPGALTLAASGIGALAAVKFPGLRRALSIANKPKPTINAARITEPLNEVEEIVTYTPTKMERGQETIRNVSKAQQDVLDKLGGLKAAVENQPLSFGGKQSRFGSALYDFLIKHPSKKALKPAQWEQELSNFNRLSQIKVPGTNVSGRVTKEELFDTNIAHYDKNNKLVGGFLKFAKDSNMPVDKLTLAKMVERAPASNLSTIRHSYDKDIVPQLDAFYDTVQKDVDVALKVIDDVRKTDTSPRTKAFFTSFDSNINDELKAIERNLGKASATADQIREGHRGVNLGYDNLTKVYEGLDELQRIGSSDLTSKNNIINLPFDPAQKLNSLKVAQRPIDLKLSQPKKGPQYGGEYSYKIRGGERTFEDVVTYNKTLPFGRDIKSGEFGAGHYTDTVPKNQVYFTRYQQRSTDVPGQKVMAIDEIQSDIQQAAFKKDPLRGKVVNPSNNEYVFEQNNMALNKLMSDMEDIARKKDRMTKEDVSKFYKLSKEFEELKSNTINSANLNSQRERLSNREVPWMPFFDRASYGDHAIKNVLKSASEAGADWVVVNPVERLHVTRDLSSNGKVGNWEFYGTAVGKSGRKGIKARSDKTGSNAQTDFKKDATLPAVMKKIAKQYDTEAKPIKVSLSDPSKEYKIMKGLYSEDLEENARIAKKYGVNPASAFTHVGAYKTEQQATNLLKYFGDDGYFLKRVKADDPDLYYEAFGVKTTPAMKGQPFKLYQREGGLAVNIFA